jgi:hypothetical protein
VDQSRACSLEAGAGGPRHAYSLEAGAGWGLLAEGRHEAELARSQRQLGRITVGVACKRLIRSEGRRTPTTWSRSPAAHTCAADQGRRRGGTLV